MCEMKIYSPKERLKELELPNLFNYATKELSQDAFLCWSLEWRNIRGYQMCEFAYLLLKSFINSSIYKNQINPLDIENVEIKKQYKNIDILILINLKNELTLPIIIEDKVDTTTHSNQIDRYINIIKSEYLDFPEPICILYKIGYIFEQYSDVSNNKCIIYDKLRILNIMKEFEDVEMPLLFCDYYAYLVAKQKYEDSIIFAYDRAIRSGDINILIGTLDVDIAQWELMKRLTSNMEENAYRFIRRGNNPDGRPWTQYDIDDSNLKGNDLAFYRIDKNNKGYYLSLRQYLKFDTQGYMNQLKNYDKDVLFKEKMNRLNIYRENFKKSVKDLNSKIVINTSNRGVYESEIGSFQLDSIDNLIWLEKNLPIVTKNFLQLVTIV